MRVQAQAKKREGNNSADIAGNGSARWCWSLASQRPLRKFWLSCPLPEKKHGVSSSTSNDTSSTVVHWPSHWAGPRDASTHRSYHSFSIQLYTLQVSGRITSRRPWPKLSHDRNARVYGAAMHEAEKGILSGFNHFTWAQSWWSGILW